MKGQRDYGGKRRVTDGVTGFEGKGEKGSMQR